jgi:hypothetical protein
LLLNGVPWLGWAEKNFFLNFNMAVVGKVGNTHGMKNGAKKMQWPANCVRPLQLL